MTKIVATNFVSSWAPNLSFHAVHKTYVDCYGVCTIFLPNRILTKFCNIKIDIYTHPSIQLPRITYLTLLILQFSTLNISSTLQWTLQYYTLQNGFFLIFLSPPYNITHFKLFVSVLSFISELTILHITF